ncbi:sensor domain-containing diguanylate cyclase [Falsiroseomonas oryzae]|uniref:sensor domain-containing diguanylate cyclase n=1 Tax=Falsiroseomonas oryzae TaxID=2766473 RepID=UPI0022EA5960|nr:GGDEF domain-containing protein [Roseomonas sp. MO-31]
MKAALLASALIAVCALGAAAALYSQKHLQRNQARLVELHRIMADAQRLQLLIADSKVTIRHWMLSGRRADREISARSGEQLRDVGRELSGRLEEALRIRGLPSIGAMLEHVLRVRDQAHETIEQYGIEAARELSLRAGGTDAARQLLAVLEELRRALEAELGDVDRNLWQGQTMALLLLGASALAMLLLLLAAVGLLARRHAAAERSRAELDARGQEVATLFRMGELLQSSHSPEDIRRIVSHTAEELLPDLPGAFYVFNNSRDRLDVLGVWGHRGLPPRLPDHFAPGECWALKRGRPHGRVAGDSLRCDHAADEESCTLCVPMQARGEVYGVLQFFGRADVALPPAQTELAQALADGVSLALANLALREKLRNQALRDELTGLHNRRFLDETLPRLVAHAERRGAPIAVLMLDLDHFKQVNDRYGHAMGDAVLREVGALLQVRLRRMDIACRYGGEELLVLMPDCSAQEALRRAHELCAQVRGLRDQSHAAVPAVTVSIGVAAWPEHAEDMAQVIQAADAALYAAKRQGRDRAVPAEAALAGTALAGLPAE